jgi:hypothetical protein
VHSVFYTACQPGRQHNVQFHLQWESILAQEVVYFSKKNIFCYLSYQSWQDTSQTHLLDRTSVYLLQQNFMLNWKIKCCWYQSDIWKYRLLADSGLHLTNKCKVLTFILYKQPLFSHVLCFCHTKDHHFCIFLFSAFKVLYCDVMPGTTTCVFAAVSSFTPALLLYFQTPKAFHSIHTFLSVSIWDNGLEYKGCW